MIIIQQLHCDSGCHGVFLLAVSHLTAFCSQHYKAPPSNRPTVSQKLLDNVLPSAPLHGPTDLGLSNLSEVADFIRAACNFWSSPCSLPLPLTVADKQLSGSEDRTRSAYYSVGVYRNILVSNTKLWASSILRITWFAPFPYREAIHSRGIFPGLVLRSVYSRECIIIQSVHLLLSQFIW